MTKALYCVWCGERMNCDRASKKVCSNTCQKAFQRWVEHLHINNITALTYLQAIKLFGGQHPNPKYNETSYEQEMPIL